MTKAEAPIIFVCSCEGTMAIDGAAIAAACGTGEVRTARHLCRSELDRFRSAVAERPVIVGCTQEAPLFAQEAEASGAQVPVTVNLRESAGWSDEARHATPKILALIAQAARTLPPVPTVSMNSEGVALIYGRDEVAIEAARQLQDKLDITVLLSRPGEVMPPRATDFPIVKGTIRTARGHLGAFEIVVDDYATPAPSSRRSFLWGPSRNEASSKCDLIIDLTGGPPLFSAAHLRDGYLRADPADPSAVQRVLFQAADLVGTFDKPRYVDFTESLCAHSRSRRTGCTRCLDVCPTGAITPKGDHVEIDPFICGGCGGCAAVCPTGAASYALPPHDAALDRMRTLLTTYRAAGGDRPVVLIHDQGHGWPLIDLSARFGDGLPARVLPLTVNSVTQIGIELLAGAFAYGASALRVLVPARPKEDLTPLARTLGLAQTFLSGWGLGDGRVGLIESDDPDMLGQALRALPDRGGIERPSAFLALGDKRGLMKTALSALHAVAPAPIDVLPLPPGAPFGTVVVDTDGCTLCLSCVSACPTGALSDDPDRPRLSFTEDACVQCGLCKSTCPEKVITLVPRFDATTAAKSPRTIKAEEPFHCIRCGTPFGVRSTIERVTAKLAGTHWMFGDSQAVDALRMCADCRVIVQTERGFDPHAAEARPKPKTAADYE